MSANNGEPETFRIEEMSKNFADPEDKTKWKGVMSVSGRYRIVTSADGENEF
jgi:hypothetical protein